MVSSARSSIASTRGQRRSCGSATTRPTSRCQWRFDHGRRPGSRDDPRWLLKHLAGALRFYEEVQADASGGSDHELEKQVLISSETSSRGMTATPQVSQFKLVLVGVEPPIWRRIQVLDTYSFWDLHVALQDTMGWLDYHLHVFRVARPGLGGEVEQIDIPDDDRLEGDKPTLPGWEIPITRHFLRPGTAVPYEYDFGDGWEHELTLEAVLPRQAGQKYPLCVDGARACLRGLRWRVRLRESSDRDPGPHPRGVREHLTWLGGRISTPTGSTRSA